MKLTMRSPSCGVAVENTQVLTMQTTVTDVTSRSAFSFTSSAQPTMFPSPQHSATGREYGALHEVRKLIAQVPAPSTLPLDQLLTIWRDVGIAQTHSI